MAMIILILMIILIILEFSFIQNFGVTFLARIEN